MSQNNVIYDNNLTTKELAEKWGISASTIHQWRWSGKGPKFLKLGGRISYPPEEIKQFEKEKLKRSTSEYFKADRIKESKA